MHDETKRRLLDAQAAVLDRLPLAERSELSAATHAIFDLLDAETERANMSSNRARDASFAAENYRNEIADRGRNGWNR